MTTTHDDNATTWRDLADQLTAGEVSGLEGLEQDLKRRRCAEDFTTDFMLKTARSHITGRLADTAYADVPAPPDITFIGEWEQDLKLGGWSRAVVWRASVDATMGVDIDGRQHCDGTVERGISLYVGEGAQLTSAGARRLAALLVEAADELDGLR